MKSEWKTLLIGLIDREIKNITEFSLTMNSYPDIYSHLMKEIAQLNALREYLVYSN